ncbi:UDP-glycosyltransferase 86A1-like isoform X2 [Andrographis paniculata]|uniref:UDP-glycosyltransferase 86A1-like isoform X2 n=1 Tax=Andrographis paniculata TaxID=175694 RepID=UPI0021E95118|nr:UDP-glycosyltransferase 86A1-like isoform X2 [Andrographis paniculata]
MVAAALRRNIPHAIMISLPYQGHVNPFVSLALKLASRGIAVTFVHLDHIHRRLSESRGRGAAADSDIFAEARRSSPELDIRYTTISDGLPLEYNRDENALEYFTHLIEDFPKVADKFVGKLIAGDMADSGSRLIHFLVADTVWSWPAAIARKYNLINVSFWTEPALIFSLCYHWDIMRQNGHVAKDNETEVEITYLPGIKTISSRDLMSYMNENEGILAKTLTVIFDDIKKTDFILHNTVQELESQTLSALSKHQPNYAIGPINFSKNLPTTAVSKSFWSESELCNNWLDSKSRGSVLYVSFGSVVQIPKQELHEIAHGLLLSGVDFLWVVRAGISSDGGDVLPEGYEEKIRDSDRGLVVPWCDQIKVLESPAVGGFLTHCGWNSTVESMWCGVPMICRPVTFDQPTNKKLVVDDWGVGVDLYDGGGSKVDRKGVAEKIRRFMNSDKVRKAASHVKETVRNAMAIEGSSERNFERFVGDLNAKIQSSC